METEYRQIIPSHHRRVRVSRVEDASHPTFGPNVAVVVHVPDYVDMPYRSWLNETGIGDVDQSVVDRMVQQIRRPGTSLLDAVESSLPHQYHGMVPGSRGGWWIVIGRFRFAMQQQGVGRVDTALREIANMWSAWDDGDVFEVSVELETPDEWDTPRTVFGQRWRDGVMQAAVEDEQWCALARAIDPDWDGDVESSPISRLEASEVRYAIGWLRDRGVRWWDRGHRREVVEAVRRSREKYPSYGPESEIPDDLGDGDGSSGSGVFRISR